ncbi:MAG TPA: NADH-quinone oxidoreductase subunit L [Ferrovibrio sp.]|uniref:NADH-quinone oxidoreductase subunit L n=1 Tax=Ferrovibrio sp. TaxID=1917215 RepID=UPI002B4AB105|nr:NADH-quinone oxidoreductase subunit L [Ferrovibrio sp.]HLT76746.1 NADH-quinone oxidoreductase subunit L [Ferrovibrio sp.]
MYHLIVFLPLLAAIVAGLFGRRIGDVASMAVTCVAVIISAVLSWVALYLVVGKGMVVTIKVLDWIDSGSFSVDWALRIDQLTAVMLVVVNTVSALVHVYSVGYMSHDPHRPRFFAYLSLFTFAMLMLVTADNFVQLYMGWEGVGLASYLLIGFWFHKPSANAAAIKAFVVNRVGDFGFALGIMTLFFATGSVNFETVFGMAPQLAGKTFSFLGGEWDILTVATFLLFLGAMGKSAQLGLHTWLPDAMEGPTPVSALIHAATMVTAGVFMVARCSPLFEFAPATLQFVTIIGASTAFFAATVGLAQNDIKRVIAYSTCSQLGYMFFALGVSAYPAAIFHLFTHAFFKALLFLGAGSVIHAVDGEQDMRRMGGLWKHIKITYAMMWIGSLALAGLPFFAGFYSKDMILEAAFAAGSGVGKYAFIMGMAAAILTAFYSWRLLFMTFHGEPRADHHVMEHVHESPMVMLVPLFVLAAGAVFAGFAFYDGMVGHHWQEFWGKSIFIQPENGIMEAAHEVPLWVKLGPIVVGLVGIAVAWWAYIRDTGLPARAAQQHHLLYQFLLNKWYFDELYDRIFVRPAMWLGRLFWKGGDGRIIDGLGPDGLAASVVRLARRASVLQSGYVYHYAFAMLIGVAALVTYFFSAMGH